jgi:hypothetical protein
MPSSSSSRKQAWAVCPTENLKNKTCIEDTSWQSSLRKRLLVTVSTQLSDTAYSRYDLSILEVRRLGTPASVPVSRALYQPIWDKLLQLPAENATAMQACRDPNARNHVRTVIHSLGFLLRLYDDVYPDDPYTPLTHLQNFLAIPLQFSTVCSVYSNYTVPALRQEAARLLGGGAGGGAEETSAAAAAASPQDGSTSAASCPISFEEIAFILKNYTMAPEMLTVARSGTSSQRLVSQHWTVWTFIGCSVGVMAATGVAFGWMVVKTSNLPNTSGVLEVDILGLAGGKKKKDGNAKSVQDTVVSCGIDDLADAEDLEATVFSAGFRRRRLRLVNTGDDTKGGAGKSLALVTMKD